MAWLVARFGTHHEELEKNRFGVASILVERIVRRDGRPEVRELGAAFEAKRTSDLLGEGDGPGLLAIARELLACY